MQIKYLCNSKWAEKYRDKCACMASDLATLNNKSTVAMQDPNM